MRFTMKCALGFFLALPLTSFAFGPEHGSVVAQIGVAATTQGKDQHVYINDLIGDQYTVNSRNQANALFGIGYLIKGMDKDQFSLSYGVNGFYIGRSSIFGTIAQENLFTNLSYQYSIRNIPVYAAAKAIIKNNNERYNITLDAGIGPNFMRAYRYEELPLNSYSLTNNAFKSRNKTTFSATAGIGIRLNHLLGATPLECGYRFFYLGEGQLAYNNYLLLNELKTGNVYANALICSVTI